MVHRVIPTDLSRSVWILCIAVLINRSTGFLALFAAIFFGSSGMEPARVSLALVITGVGGVLGSIISGKATDILGVKKILIASSLLNAPFLYALSIEKDSTLIIAYSGLSVFFSQAFIPPASTLIAKSSKGKDRVSLFAFFRIFINVGSVIAPSIAGILGEGSFPKLFTISSLFAIVTAIILLFMRDEKGCEEKSANYPSSSARINKPLILLLVSMAGTMLVYAQHQGAIPLEMQERENGMRIFSSLLLINPILVVLIEYPLSHFTKKMHWKSALSVGVLIMASGIVITGWVPILFFTYLGWVIFTVGECIFAPMSNTAIAEISEEHDTGKNQGLLGAWQAVGMAFGPAVGSGLLNHYNTLTWPMLYIFSIICIVLIYAAEKTYKKSMR